MRPKVLTISPYAAADPDAIATSQTPAAGGIQDITIDGALASGGVATLDEPRQVQLTTAADETARVFSIEGTDRKGNFQIEAIDGVNATTAVTVKAFATVTRIRVDDDTAMAIQFGTSTVVSTNWYPLDYLQDFAVSLALNIPAGTGTPDFTVELTNSNLLDYQGSDIQPGRGQHVAGIGGLGAFDRKFDFITPFDHDTLANVTATGVTSGNIAFPVRALRLTANTVFTTNDVDLEVVQQIHGHA